MLSRFFIDRPVVAATSILVALAAGIAVVALLVTRHAGVALPTVEVSAHYPGANAKSVADSVAAPIEQQVDGVEGMVSMSSQCTDDGNFTLTVTFRPGSDLNIAQVLVQNRVAMVQPILPLPVQRHGVTVKRKLPGS